MEHSANIPTSRQGKISTGFDVLPKPPSVTAEDAAWATPATEAQYAEAVTYVLSACEPGIDTERIGVFIRLLRSRRYGAAELAYAAHELPFDEVVNDKLRFGRPILPADFERVIKAHRRRQQMLRRPISRRDAEALALCYPGEIEMAHFHCCGFDERNEPLWLYRPDLPPAKADPVATLADPSPARRSGGVPVPISLAVGSLLRCYDRKGDEEQPR